MLSKTEAEKPREHRIHAGEEKPVSGAPGRGDCAAEAEPPVEGIVLAVGMTPESQMECARYSSEALSHLAEVHSVCLLGILFPSLSISETSVVPWNTEELPLTFGWSWESPCQSCQRPLNGSCSPSVLFWGCRNLSLHGNPIVQGTASFIPPHSQAPQRLSPLPQVLPGVRWASLLFADTTVPFWYGAMSVLFFAAPAFASVSHGTQTPQDQSASRSIREFAFKILPQSSPEVRRQLTFLLA